MYDRLSELYNSVEVCCATVLTRHDNGALVPRPDSRTAATVHRHRGPPARALAEVPADHRAVADRQLRNRQPDRRPDDLHGRGSLISHLTTPRETHETRRMHAASATRSRLRGCRVRSLGLVVGANSRTNSPKRTSLEIRSPHASPRRVDLVVYPSYAVWFELNMGMNMGSVASRVATAREIITSVIGKGEPD